MAKVRDMTTHLIECLALDMWPRAGAVVDFGIKTPSHLGALQYAWRNGVTPEEFDAALGNGRALTKLVQTPDNPYRFVTFVTDWDNPFLDEEEKDDEPTTQEDA